MRKLFSFVFFAILAISLPAHAATENSTPEQAQAMVKKAIAYYKTNGKEKALAAVNDTAGPFNERDLYVVAYDLNGSVLAHGANKKLVGKNIIDMQDVDGVMVMKEQLLAGKGKNGGWVNYKWPHPITKNLTPKSMYNEVVDDIMFACGVYK
ncbi:cache domain-containing protein [Undibacterium sp. TS12]|uniref:cache domain-containing protein n=1 Tax=Undibacterium sp. TS12 TaxID=2908202 RepID=UPI001F4CEA79|nr:cache domain-containing protein [Undibacterium sp. TS12]MCH8618701.1 cache domain-containing protein [Undibacterium sp. TS12]